MSKRRRIRIGLWGILLLALVGLAATLAWTLQDLPDPDSLATHFQPPSVRITDRNGRLLYETLGQGGGRHTVVRLEDIPLPLRQATIATEDRSFYANPGVDPIGILRSVWINLQGRTAGGSTLTQQVARNLLLSEAERGERSLRRKLREAFLAWRLTQRYSKDEILAVYLNQTYYGGMAYGVEAAAQTYFGKSVSELGLGECALLAGLPQAPALYNPYTDLEAARERQSVVLGLMQTAGKISAEERRQAERETLQLAASPYPLQAPHFVMMVQAQLDGLFTPEDVYASGGLVVRTTLDLDWQQAAERAIRRQVEDMQRSEDGLGHNLNNAALVALDPSTGEILALVGSPDYFDAAHSGAVNMVTAPRQPGSALKPVIYAAALDPSQPEPWTAATMLLDVQTSFVTHDGKAYTPANYDLRQHGPVLVRQALASSLNIPAVLTLDHVTLKTAFSLANRLGISSLQNPERYDLSLALGGGEVNLLELTGAYGAFANGGHRVTPVAILEVSTLQGEPLYTASAPPKARVLDERVAWLISDILSDNEARRLGFGPNSILRLDRPAAVKTGTTTNWHDNWTVGYTPNLVVGVWAGNSNYEPMRDVNGLAGAAPIWHQFMRQALTGKPVQVFTRPTGLVKVDVCALSGRLPTEACTYRRQEWFIDGTQPTQMDTFYQRVTLDRQTGNLALADTPLERRVVQTVLDLPPAAQPWARQQGIRLLSDLLVGSEPAGPGNTQVADARRPVLRITSPAAQSVYYIAANRPADMQRLRLEAVATADVQAVTLVLDGVTLATFEQGPYVAWWQLADGEHQVWATARGANGEMLRSEVIVFRVVK